MYEIYEVMSDGSKVLVGQSELNMGAVSVVYDTLIGKVDATLQNYVNDRTIKSEDKAAMVSSVLNNVTNQSMFSVGLAKDVAIKENQRKLNAELLPLRVNAAKFDNDTKEQRLLSEKIRNGGVSFDYVFYKFYYDADNKKIETDYYTGDDVESVTVGDVEYVLRIDFNRVKSKALSNGTGLSTIELNNLKIINDIEQLVKSIEFNNMIKGNEQLSDVIKNIYLGGNNPGDNALTAFLTVIKQLTDSVVNSADLNIDG